MAFLAIDTQMERGEGKRAELPQWFADRFGWEELVAQVASIYRELPPADRDRAILIAPTYGHAGAIELLGRDRGLPPVISPHNTYHSWARETLEQVTPEVAISLGLGPEDLAMVFDEIQRVSVYECQFCMNWRNDMPIYIARGLKLSSSELRQAWELAKHYE
jgi:hypothetical protein